jgi:NTE family protein
VLVLKSRPDQKRRVALVLGGGGLKGFAHIGVLRALQERGIEPSLFAGTSIGALLASAHVTGMSLDDMDRRARAIKRRDLFRINHMGMLLERMRAPSIYLEEPLRNLVRDVVPHVRFDDVTAPLLVNTVDVEHGIQVIWGLPGHRDVYLDDAVYASCALPGFFPPGRVDGRVCVDGGVIDNLPVAIAAMGMDAVIAVDVGNSDLLHAKEVAQEGFASIYMRAATVMMHALQGHPLTVWSGPPMILIRPRVAEFGWFAFGHTEEVIEAGYRAAMEALQDFEVCLEARSGVFPRHVVQITVNQEKCTGCGLCAALAPQVMGLDLQGKAFAKQEVLDWTPADGEFVRHCPQQAIEIRRRAPVLQAAS